jgi:hypothetical protein
VAEKPRRGGQQQGEEHDGKRYGANNDLPRKRMLGLATISMPMFTRLRSPPLICEAREEEEESERGRSGVSLLRDLESVDNNRTRASRQQHNVDRKPWRHERTGTE